eukprot:TRINITY_DN19408_c0_g1_i1.p1 TRINITY_DN19408_c0_g1~~TRINITY_DN19408_c0_g1_i1.p1  ORF type:complete len:146 (+),score=32.20 TRINITY_DN19408_c0_g1_i1:2-439(+)
MNKFDDMMAYLKNISWQKSRLMGSGSILGQVVAVDVNFVILTRVWCIAELLEAYKIFLPQALKVHSGASCAASISKLKELDVREAQATFPADKDFVLAKVDDVDSFNQQVRGLVISNLKRHFLATSVLDVIIDDFVSLLVESIIS